jgi:hypothetical protein
LEVGPVVVPNGWDYAAASMWKWEGFEFGIRLPARRGLRLRPGGKREFSEGGMRPAASSVD